MKVKELLGGIIPARAGFTVSVIVPFLSCGDHPRSRGVYALDHVTSADVEGSSPLARGLPGGRRQAVPSGRIIPARAGFTSVSGMGSSPLRDHPRSRGVYRANMAYKDSSDGSSPLARGLR